MSRLLECVEQIVLIGSILRWIGFGELLNDVPPIFKPVVDSAIHEAL